MPRNLPELDLDMWSNAALDDPYPVYKQMRDLGPVVYLPRHDLYAVSRYADVKAVLQDWQTYSSAQGVGFNETLNSGLAGSLIGSDPPDHVRYRKILERPMVASELKQVRDQIMDMCRKVVAGLEGRQKVEAVTELAAAVPLMLVAELVGLPDGSRERMLEWAAAGFNALAPAGTPRVAEGIDSFTEMTAYFNEPSFLDRTLPGSWASQLKDAAAAGEITHQEALTFLQMNYTFAALDTTIHSVSNLLWLLARNPDAWRDLRSNRSLIGRAVNESLRLEGPVQAFSRVATCDALIDGAQLVKGDRLLLAYASANRDERHYSEPERFDIYRNATDHLAFGFSEHLCLGRNLATLEMTLLLAELVDKIEHLSLIDAVRDRNNSLRGFATLNLKIHHGSETRSPHQQAII